MESVLVLHPSPGIGHVVPMVEFGKLALKHCPSVSIIILIVTPPFQTGDTASYISDVSAAFPSITFHHVPTTPLPLPFSSYPSMEVLTSEFLTLNKPNVQRALLSISLISTILAVVIDFFCTPALSSAKELNLPAYYFFTSSATGLALLLYVPTLHRKITQSFRDMSTIHDVPGVPPVPMEEVPGPLRNPTSKEYELFLYHASNISKSDGIITQSFRDMSTIHDVPGVPPVPMEDVPGPLRNPTSKEYEFFLYYASNISKSDGIIVNTFEALEAKPVKAIRDGLCLTDSPTPPMFCIGPLIAKNGGHSSGRERECLKWLNSQPKRSVVFLCFGSLGVFSEAQLKEIAVGLEKSGQRFLWVVRSPRSKDKIRSFLAPPDPDLNALLPDGFLDRTKERGLVVKSWAPQMAVLSHGSVGGFVTHCGWNSVLEAMSCGVPMVAWPLYAEQRFNKVVMVEEMKVALPLEESKTGMVTAAEVEKRLRELMDKEKGYNVRNRVTAMKEEAMAAMCEGGSSFVALDNLIKSWKQTQT